MPKQTALIVLNHRCKTAKHNANGILNSTEKVFARTLLFFLQDFGAMTPAKTIQLIYNNTALTISTVKNAC